MPEMDGFEVLDVMNRNHWIEDTPVIIISSEGAKSYVRRAYELGASDYISRPFDTKTVYQRVMNTVKLYARQQRLINLVTNQIYEKKKNDQIMTEILSQIVDFRNGESGAHVMHVGVITGMLLERLFEITDRYCLEDGERELIIAAAPLHDIGKIGIDEKILNKPGKLTAEEFEKIKEHTLFGEQILNNLKEYQNERFIQITKQICRWHHERYDGNGYPDGLSGDDIPIAAQVVALADVYDALTSDRVYKKAVPHEKAMQMILSGECGVFNPILKECLIDIEAQIQKTMHT